MAIKHLDSERKRLPNPPAPIGRPSGPYITVGILAERFPSTFTTELAKVRPLAIGIYHVLAL
jgi:hypothetical protein